jgi:hypothetical protein
MTVKTESLYDELAAQGITDSGSEIAEALMRLAHEVKVGRLDASDWSASIQRLDVKFGVRFGGWILSPPADRY